MLGLKITNIQDFPDGPWLRLFAPNAGGLDLSLGQGTRSHMWQLRVHMLVLKIPQGAMKIEDSACRSYDLAQPDK